MTTSTVSTTRLLVCVSLVLLSCAAEDTPRQRDVTEKRLLQMEFSLWIPSLFAVSPDSQRVAYGVRAEQKQFIIVDG